MAEGRIRGCGARPLWRPADGVGTSRYLCVCAQFNVPRARWRQLPAVSAGEPLAAGLCRHCFREQGTCL